MPRPAIIKEIEIGINDGFLRTSVAIDTSFVDGEPLVSYYVMKNEEKIHTSQYSQAKDLELKIDSTAGYYRSVAFVRLPDGKIEHRSSSPIFHAPKILSKPLQPNCLSKGPAIISGKHWNISILFFPSSHKRLFILMPSAINRRTTTLPAFSRWTWAGADVFPGNVLCVSDPTIELHQQLQIGWMLGTKSNPVLDDLVIFIEEFAETHGIPSEHIIFYGSSAGGFSALAAAARERP